MELSAPTWSDAVDEILAGDQAVALATVTPARGVVLTPVTNFGMRDRTRGTVTFNSSVAMSKKLDRIQRNPHVAVAFHTREHGFSDRPEYVLVQGRAELIESPGWLEDHLEEWERFAGPRRVGPLWERWLRIYHQRVAIEVSVERVVVWPSLGCGGDPDVVGAPLPDDHPEPQRPPRGGTGPRVSTRRTARWAARLPHVLLGWTGADGLPMVVPVEVQGAEPDGVALTTRAGIVPPGGRRAGLTAHWFTRYVRGQNQRVHTGWLESSGADRLVYAPHTQSGYVIPPSKTAYKLVAGYGTRRGLRRSGKADWLGRPVAGER